MKNQRDGGRARMSTTHLCYDGGDPIPHNGPARMALPVGQMLNLERPICLALDRTNRKIGAAVDSFQGLRACTRSLLEPLYGSDTQSAEAGQLLLRPAVLEPQFLHQDLRFLGHRETMEKKGSFDHDNFPTETDNSATAVHGTPQPEL